MTHTSGPWRFFVRGCPATDAFRVESADGHRVAMVARNDEAVANAHLITAAPELLEALKALISYPAVLEVLAPVESLGSLRAQAYAAIAKADGAV